MYVFYSGLSAGFFRIEDIPHLKYGDISFHSNHVTINVDRKEIDQLRKGSKVVISKSTTIVTCSVKSFEAFLSEVEKFPVEAGHYVFKTFFNGKFN